MGTCSMHAQGPVHALRRTMRRPWIWNWRAMSTARQKEPPQIVMVSEFPVCALHVPKVSGGHMSTVFPLFWSDVAISRKETMFLQNSHPKSFSLRAHADVCSDASFHGAHGCGLLAYSPHADGVWDLQGRPRSHGSCTWRNVTGWAMWISVVCDVVP